MKTTLYRRDKTSEKARRKAWSRNANTKRLRNIAERHERAMLAIANELAEGKTTI